MVYLRRLDRRRSMETVRGLDWGVAGTTAAGDWTHGEAEAGVAPSEREDARLVDSPKVGDAS